MYALGDLSEDCGVTMECHEVCDPNCIGLIGIPGFTHENCCSDQCSVPGVSTTFDAALVGRPGGCEIMRTEIEAYSTPAPRAASGGILTEAESRALNAAITAGALRVDVMGRPVDASGRLVDPYTLQVIPGQASVTPIPASTAPTPPPAGTKTIPSNTSTPGQVEPSSLSLLAILTEKHYGLPTWAYLAGGLLIIPRLLQRGPQYDG